MTAEFELRPYQVASINALRRAVKAARESDTPQRVVLCAPTGAGKTVMGAFLMAESRRKGNRCSFVVDRCALADQTSSTLHHYGVSHGVLQGDNTYAEQAPAMVVSTMTANSRGWPPDMDLLIVDECHTLYTTTKEHIKRRMHPIIGLTATPFPDGMAELYPAGVVNVCTTNELIADGFLAPLRVYCAKEVDVSQLPARGDTWKGMEGEALKIVGDIVSEWVQKTAEHFGGPVKTICFSASIAHGEEICRQFADAGYRFEQVHANDNDERRRALIEEFRKPDSDIVGLVSVEALAKGFDVPDIMCGIGARPYRKSLSGHIQQMGRAMRAYPGKDYALWLDHSGNYLRFQDETERFWAEGCNELKDGREKPKKELTEKEKSERVCSCGAIIPPAAENCPGCGKPITRKALIETVNGTLVAIGESRDSGLRDVWAEVLCDAYRRGKSRNWGAKVFEVMFGRWPNRSWGDKPAVTCSSKVANQIQHQLIRYAKGKGKAA